MENESKACILLVEDSKICAAQLTEILKNDYRLLVVNSGTKAIEMAKEHQPDLILLDIIMPELDGYETLEILKVNPKTRDIPVIFISSLDEESDEARGLSLGAADYITKPFNSVIVKLRVQLQINMSNQLKTIGRLSMMDHLTNIPNRKYFDRRLFDEWDRAYRNSINIGLMIVDIDNFATYNETYGHQQGDAALVGVAKILVENVTHPGDLVARWSGDSFAVLLLEADADKATLLAEQIRQAAQKVIFTGEMTGDETNVTLSIGICVGSPSSKKLLDKFISHADAALFRAKDNGRNRIEIQKLDL